MQFLLTSAGIHNQSIARALVGMLPRNPGDISIAYIPTASNVEEGDKDWVIDDLVRLQQCATWKQLDIVDIAALPRTFWEPRLRAADVLFVGGGNEYFLMYHIQQSGLLEILPELLKTRVWVGVSAGSTVAGKKLKAEVYDLIYSTDMAEPFNTVESYLGYVDFGIKNHMNSEFFPKASEGNLAAVAPQVGEPFYAIDDDTALQIVDGNVTVISEGAWRLFN